MSDTPRTDHMRRFRINPATTPVVPRDFAYELERENNALRAKLAETEGRLEALRESRRVIVEVKP